MSEILKDNPENNLKNIQETTEWDELEKEPFSAGEKDVDAIMDSVDVPETTFEDTSSAETSSEYLATDQEIFQKIINQMDQDRYMLERNGISPETKRDMQESRDTLVEAYAETKIATDNNEAPKSLISALESRKSIYDEKATIYEDFQDENMVAQNLRRSQQTSDLIKMANNVKDIIEREKDPNSDYNRYANLFK